MDSRSRFVVVAALVLISAGCQRQAPSPDGELTQVRDFAGEHTQARSPAQPGANAIRPSPVPRPGETPKGFVRMTVGGIAPTPQGNAVLLVDEQKARGIPIFIGETEALSIQLRLEKRRYDRPLTHDLLDSMLGQLGGRVDCVRVDKIQDNVYFGTVVVVNGARRIELDSRSSDAVALAVGHDAPIFVARPVLERAGIELEALQSHPSSADPPELPLADPAVPTFTL